MRINSEKENNYGYVVSTYVLVGVVVLMGICSIVAIVMLRKYKNLYTMNQPV